MRKKTAPRQKHVPQRTCVGCKQVLPKRTLVRVVRTDDGVKVDSSGRLNGRGAYLHDRRTCWLEALNGSLARALKTELTVTDREALFEFASGLSDEALINEQ